MANTISIDALRQEVWSKDFLDEVGLEVEAIMPFVGEDENSVVQIKKELSKAKGDIQTFGLLARLRGDGVDGDNELEGNEEAMSTYAEQVAIDQKRHGVRLKGKLDEQKSVYDQISGAKANLKTWMAEFKVRQMFLKLGGVTNPSLVDTNGDATSLSCAWSNTPDYIPDADTAAGYGNRYLSAYAGSAASMGAGNTLTLDIITNAYTKASLARLQKIQSGGDSFYVMFVHPLCARDLRKSSDWKTAQENAKVRSDKNPVFRGVLGFWSNVMLVESEFVPWLDVSVAGNSFRGTGTGTDYAVDTAANLLCGRQAALMAEASDPKALIVKQFDYGNKDGVACSFIGGIQKAMFNSKEFGVIVVDAAAAV